MFNYAFCHPGKIGDALYTLPTIHAICERDNATATFFTSELCLPLRNLFLYQKHIVDFIVPPQYVIQGCGQGVQPWQVPVPKARYDKIYQLGYEWFPNKALHLFSGQRAGLSLKEIPDPAYDFPDKTFYEEPYIVMAYSGARGYPPMYETYEELMRQCPIKVVVTGVSYDMVKGDCENLIGLDLLDTLALLSRAELFVGFYSGLLALANGFPELQKVVTLQHQGCGEQHGPDIANTTRVLFPPGPTVEWRHQIFHKALLDTVLGLLGVDKQ
jgi:hypothetical protein